jgi:hypothetical protein
LNYIHYNKIIILFAIITLSCLPCFAADYYIDADGTNCSSPSDTDYDPSTTTCGGGGSDKVWTTINGCIGGETLSGGDTIYIRSGTYTESVSLTTADDGSGGDYVTFKTYENEDVTIRTTSASRPLYIYEPGATVQYIKFDGRGDDSGKHFTFTTTTATDCIIIRRANYIWITGANLHNAQGSGRGIYMLSQEYGTDSGGSNDDNGPKNCIIEYSNFYNNDGHGIKVTGWGTDSNTIRYNNSYNNGVSEGGDDQGMNMSGSGYAANPPTGNIVYNNNFYNNYGNGASILSCPSTQFYNNVIYENGDNDDNGSCDNNAARGFVVSGISDNCTVYNNIIYENCYYGLEVNDTDSGLYYNNLFYLNGNAVISGSGIMLQGNAKNMQPHPPPA